MPTTTSNLEKLKKILFPGTTPSTTAPDDLLSKAIQDIAQYKGSSGKSGYVNLMRTLISQTGSNLDQNLFTGNIASGQGAYTPSAFGQANRLLRYKLYDSIVANISYCHRALNVIVDNVLSPDDITKISLTVSPSDDESGEETDVHVEFIKRLIKGTDLEKYLLQIVKNTLKMGDYFCEVADSKTALTSKSFLSESVYYVNPGDVHSIEEKLKDDDSKKIIVKLDFSLLNEEKRKNTKVKKDEEEYNDLILTEASGAEELPSMDSKVEEKEEDEEEDRKAAEKPLNKKPDVSSFSGVHYIFHEGKYIIKLQSELYSLCFGYLVFPKVQILTRMNAQEDAVNNVCNKILLKIQEAIPSIKNLNLKDPDELKDIIKSILMSTNLSHAIVVRYVPPNRMIHFKMPSERYLPYGESIFDSVSFNCKVLMALEAALTIHRINRSTEKRKIGIEIGLPRDAKKLVENLKQELNKRKVCLDDFSTIDSIPSAIATFEDIYIPQKDGNPFVHIDTFSDAGADTRGKVDELKFMRDSIVAALMVPPSFIGIEENLSNKNALSNENILFARTIINYQKIFSEQINELIEKVLDMVDPESSLIYTADVLITLPTPKTLQYENEARNTNDVVSMIQALRDLGIPVDYLKRKYLTFIDWDEVDKSETETKIDRDLSPEPLPGDMDMGMGMGMGGMGMTTPPVSGGGIGGTGGLPPGF